jgi:hypothetical protein
MGRYKRTPESPRRGEFQDASLNSLQMIMGTFGVVTAFRAYSAKACTLKKVSMIAA